MCVCDKMVQDYQTRLSGISGTWRGLRGSMDSLRETGLSGISGTWRGLRGSMDSLRVCVCDKMVQDYQTRLSSISGIW